MSDDHKLFLLKPFGPAIAKVTIHQTLVDTLNDYIDETIKNTKKTKELNHGHRLAGNVQQEFKLDQEFVQKSGWLNFLSQGTAAWIKMATGNEIKKFELLHTWVVRQFKNEYNPLHVHDGHISGVGYLKVPKNFGEYSQSGKKVNKNGELSLVHGSRQFLSNATYNVQPKVGEFYFFPNYLMHTVYPFHNTDEERRSISFNANIDDGIYNVYGAK